MCDNLLDRKGILSIRGENFQIFFHICMCMDDSQGNDHFFFCVPYNFQSSIFNFQFLCSLQFSSLSDAKTKQR